MVELASYSSVDWSDSVVNRDKAEALKSNSQKARLCTHHRSFLTRS
jgi:hypothetical protein